MSEYGGVLVLRHFSQVVVLVLLFFYSLTENSTNTTL